MDRFARELHINHSLIFLGYLAKKLATRPVWLKCSNVDLIASISECVSPAPPDWISRWEHNDVGFYDTEALAKSIIAPDSASEYTMFAYSALPILFQDGNMIDWGPWAQRTSLAPTLDARYDERLGFDIVGFSGNIFFECSPLSCNGMASEIEVNRFCLVDDIERAIDIAKRFSMEESGVEPAWAYVVIEVKTRKSHEAHAFTISAK